MDNWDFNLHVSLLYILSVQIDRDQSESQLCLDRPKKGNKCVIKRNSGSIVGLLEKLNSCEGV